MSPRRENDLPLSQEVFGIRSGGSFRWLLPAFLTLLPLLLVYPSIGEEKARQAESEERRRLAASEPVVARMREASTLRFWATTTARRLKVQVERRLRGHRRRGAPPPSAISLSDALTDLGDRYRLAGIPPMRVWAFSLSDTAAQAKARPLKLPGLEVTYGRVLGQIFEAMADTVQRQTPLPRRIFQTAQETFGAGVTRDFLSAAGQGTAHYVIFQGRFHLMAWDFWSDAGKAVGGFLLLMEIPRGDNHLALDLTLRHWDRLIGKRPIWPAFFLFPGPRFPGAPPRLIHPTLAEMGLEKPLARLATRKVSIRRAKETLGAVDPARWKSSPGEKIPDVMGSLDFPMERMSRCLPLGPWVTRLVGLGQDSHYFGFLVQPGPPRGAGEREKSWKTLVVFWVIGWVLILFVTVLAGRLPQPRVAVQLAGWFLCLAGMAGALVHSSHRQLLQDLETRLMDQARQEMASLARALDGEAERLTWRQSLACNRILSRPGFQDDLWRARTAGNAWHDLQRLGIQPQILAAIGTGGYLLATFSPTIAPEDQVRLANLLRGFGEHLTEQADGKPASQSSRFDLGQLFSGFGQRELSNPGTLGTTVLGGRQVCRIHQVVRKGGKVVLYLVVFWDRGRDFQAHLRRLLKRTHGREGHEVAVFFRWGSTMQLIAEAGRVTTLCESALEALPNPRFRLEAGGRFLRYLYPSPLLPGYIFALRMPLDRVADRLQAEERSFQGIIGIGLFLVLLTGIALNAWLAAPIREMTGALRRVDTGDFTVRTRLDRRDELGAATAALDQMLARLQERERMSRFVASRVMEVIRDENVGRARRGPVVMLLADIRNFTTLSENHPPEIIFATLNRHFEIMTLLIQSAGGMIERFIGDAIQAVFEEEPAGSGGNASAPPEPVARRALRAAVAMTRTMEALQAERRREGEFTYRMGIGLTAGEGVSGVVGDPEIRQDVTVLGRPVRDVAVMEAATKQFPDGTIVCSTSVREMAGPGWVFTPVPGNAAAWAVTEGPSDAAGALLVPPSSGLPIVPVVSAEERAISPAISPATPPATSALPEGVSDRPVPAATGGNRGLWRGSWTIIAAAGTFWLLAWHLMGTVADRWHADIAERRVRQARQTIRLDLLEARKAARERVQIPLYLRDEIRRAWEETPEGRGPQTTASAGLPAASPAGQEEIPDEIRPVVQSLEKLNRSWPAMSWAIVRPGGPLPNERFDDRRLTEEIWWRRNRMGFPPGEDLPDKRFRGLAATLGWVPRTTIPDEVYASRILASSAHPIPLDPWQVVIFHWMLERFRADGVRQPTQTEFERLFVPILGQHPLWFQDIVTEAFGGFRLLKLPDRETLCFWEPLSDRNTASRASCRPDDAAPRAAPLRAGILIFLPPAAITPYGGLKTMIRRLGREGTFLALKPEDRNPSRGDQALIHPYLRDGPGKALRGSGPGLRLRSGWVTGRARLETKLGRYRIQAFRRVGAAGRPPLPLRLAGVIRLLWFVGGLLAAGALALGWEFPAFSLRARLTGMFLTLMIPTLVVSSCMLGRRAIAQEEGAEAREAARLERYLQQAEDSFETIQGWNSRLLWGIVCQPRNQAGFLTIPPGKTSSDVAENAPPLASLHDQILHWGSTMSGFGVGGPGLPIHSFNPWPDFHPPSGQDHLFVHLFKRSVLFANPGLKEGQGETPVGIAPNKEDLVAEEVLTTLNLISSGEMLSEFLSAPALSCRMEWGTQSLKAFRIFLPVDRPPRMVLWVIWDYRGLLAPLAEKLRKRAMDPAPLEFRVAIQSVPGMTFAWPYVRFHPSGTGLRWSSFLEFASYDPHGLGRLISIAQHSAETVTGILGEGDQASLVMACRSPSTMRFMLSLASPIGRIWAALSAQAAQRQGFLVALLLLTIVVARLIARRFLEPLEAFSMAVQRVTAGYDRVALVIDRADEFGALAQAFNRMCRGIEEGRLLRRFVSESVRQASRDVGREEAARRGQKLDAVILFAGVTDLAERMRNLPPDEILGTLNALLGGFARVIQHRGGEIDKFVGERVLAVFSAEKHGSLERAATAALEAGRALVRETAGPDRFRDTPSGVGIVTGPVLAGILGTPAVRLEYTVLGDPVNLASRLCDLALAQSAPTVLLDSTTAALVSSKTTRCVPLGKTSIKGKSREVAVFRLSEDIGK